MSDGERERERERERKGNGEEVFELKTLVLKAFYNFGGFLN
jgi:hypothetical protein